MPFESRHLPLTQVLVTRLSARQPQLRRLPVEVRQRVRSRGTQHQRKRDLRARSSIACSPAGQCSREPSRRAPPLSSAPPSRAPRPPSLPTHPGVIGGDFTPVAPNRLDDVVIPDGFDQDLVIRWGDPVTADAPAFDVRHQTPESAARQWGYNNDYLCVLETSPVEGLLVCNHEFTNPELMFPVGSHDPATMKRVQIECHGMSVVEVRRHDAATGRWRPVPARQARRNRRITGSTPIRVVGPAAGDSRLRTTADPDGAIVLGTLNNCAGGTTPWGTVLSGEENFNQYFDKSGTLDSRYAASYARYGVTGTGSRGWSEVDPRFDLSVEPHEPFRFGWIIEVDPYDPASTPRKHTMLGRLKHEGANLATTRDGHVVAYMGDDQVNEYIYKFVSRDTVRPGRNPQAREHNMRLLETGTLYVARFSGEQPAACDAVRPAGARRDRRVDPAHLGRAVVRRRACRSPTCSSTPGSPATWRERPRWTDRRTSSRAR